MGLKSTSLRAASGEPSRARILYTRVAAILRGAVLRLPSVRRPSHVARCWYYRAHWWVEPLATCQTHAERSGSLDKQA